MSGGADDLSTPLRAATGLGSNERLCALLVQAFDSPQRSGRAARLHEDSLKAFNALYKLDGE